jgi:hypothetical protein
VEQEDIGENDVLAELPAGREEKRNLIHEHFITDDDNPNLQTVVDHLAATNENGYAVGFGADVKRLRGQVVDVFSNDTFGVMTISDETVMEEDDVDPDLVGDRQRSPGLQVFMEPDLLRYGVNSLVDVYGYIEQQKDGQIVMRGFGIVPIVEYEREYTGDSDSSEDEAVEEETI